MMCGITGTPGTGKSSAADELARRGYPVVRLIDTVRPYALGRDEGRDTLIIDEERWALEFTPVEGFVEGHLAHLLPCDRVVILRCRPDRLLGRLRSRGYGEEKCRENAEAEALDVILIETLEGIRSDRLLEIDATDLPPAGAADLIEGFFLGQVPPSHGGIDWTDYLMEGA
ncbi:MAG TPA: adenylate kinase family protein [Methanomicrobiales archaeon]|jgi:adenylate kinase|nr:adenylate kinase family protein [Methanomicrobiales archaeon]